MAKKLKPIEVPDDIEWDPPQYIRGLLPAIKKMHKTKYWPNFCREVNKIRDKETGLVPRYKMIELGKRLGVLPVLIDERRGAMPHMTLDISYEYIQVEDKYDFAALIQEAGYDPVKFAVLEWVSQNLWRIPSAFKYNKEAEYSDVHDMFDIHPMGSGRTPEAPTPAHWSWILWAAKHETQFFNMMMRYWSDAAKAHRERAIKQEKEDLLDDRIANSSPKEMPDTVSGRGMQIQEELHQRWKEGAAPPGRRVKPESGNKTIQVDDDGNVIEPTEDFTDDEFDEDDF